MFMQLIHRYGVSCYPNTHKQIGRISFNSKTWFCFKSWTRNPMAMVFSCTHILKQDKMTLPVSLDDVWGPWRWFHSQFLETSPNIAGLQVPSSAPWFDRGGVETNHTVCNPWGRCWISQEFWVLCHELDIGFPNRFWWWQLNEPVPHFLGCWSPHEWWWWSLAVVGKAFFLHGRPFKHTVGLHFKI